MLNLIPTENWDYRMADMLRGLVTALRAPECRSGIHIAGVGTCRPVRSGRAGIFLALKALRLRHKAAVGVPLYCCPVVFKAIQAAGCVPRFIDIDPATYCMSTEDLAQKSSQIDAVVAVHMFGNVCDMPALRQAAPGKPFIEDCAQALGSESDGKLAGSFGEMGVFSFRSGKYLSVGEGGALFCRDLSLDARVKELLAALPAPSRLQELVHVAETWVRSSLRQWPLWGVVGARLWQTYNARTRYASKSPLVLTRIYHTDQRLTRRRLLMLAAQIETQRSNAQFYEENLEIPRDVLCREAAGSRGNRLQYPLLTHTAAQADLMVRSLRSYHITTSRPYRDIAEIAAAHHGYTRDCPRSESIAKRVLVIPCHYDLRPKEIEWIAAKVNLAWKEAGNRSHSSAGEFASREWVDPVSASCPFASAACAPVQQVRSHSHNG